MEKMNNRGGGRTSRSALGKILSVGACSALLAAGVLLATATAASAATPASQVGFTPQPSPTATVNGAPVTFSVTIEGTDGNVANTDLSDTITITSGCSFTGTSAKGASSGVASFSLVFTQTGTCNLVATDTSHTLATPSTTSNSVTVYSTVATKLGFSVEPTTPVTAGATLNFTVQAQNGAGAHAVTGGQTDTVSITSSCTIAGTTVGTLSGGSFNFTLVSIDGGTSPCTLTATDTSPSPLAAATSTGITVNAGTPTKVLFSTQPPATVVASAVVAPFKVSVTDLFGNVETTGTYASDTVALTASTGCTLGGTDSAVAVAGVATFSAATITSEGSCTLTATDSSHTLTTATSTSVDSQGAQAALTVSSLKGFLGSPLTLTTAGGSGTGAVTFTAVPGTALGCVVTGTSLTVTSLGTCLVTATKAASLTNLAASSQPTTVTFVKPFKAVRVVGFVVAGKTSIITIIGTAFSGRPTVTSHAGTTAIVFKDTGTALSVRVKVKAGSRNGTYTFTVRLANGKTSKVKYIQRA
jgi:hypothetical protein